MDPNPSKFPILSYVMAKLPSIGPRRATGDEFDIEQPQAAPPKPEEPYFELSERMPHLTDPMVVSAMRSAVSDVAKSRTALQILGRCPDHEEVDSAKAKLAEIDANLSKKFEEVVVSPRLKDVEDAQLTVEEGTQELQKEAEKERLNYKAVIDLYEMHEAYEKMLRDAEKRLEKIYEIAASGGDLTAMQEKSSVQEVDLEVNEEILKIMQEASDRVVERVDLSNKKLRFLPDEFLGMLSSLVVLNLSNSQLEALPDSIAGLAKLEELNLSSNVLETMPDSMGLLFNLKVLDVSRNQLTALPDSICHCRSLVEIDASFNQLTYFPTNIGYELVKLERLSIQYNKLRSLPTSIGDMKSLRLLEAHFNELHVLPHSLGKLTNLEILNLSGNFSDLTELPHTIGGLTNLKELDLSNNQIHELPDTFGCLDNLTKLNVNHNPLVIPPKAIVNEGVESVKAYMVKRRLEMLMAERESSRVQQETQSSLLTRSTSWLSSTVSNVSRYFTGKTNTDPYLDQQF